MLPARSRLRKRGDFSSVVSGPGRIRAGSRLLVVHANRTDTCAGQPPRVGFVVSKALGGAVVRNRVKRRLRALASGYLSEIPTGMDLVIRANPLAASATFAELDAGLKPLVDKVSRRLEVGS